MGKVDLSVLIILSALLVGSLTSCIARAKGRSFKGWGVYGLLLPFLALPHITIAKSRPTNSRLQTVGKIILPKNSRLQTAGKTIAFCVVFYLLARYLDRVIDTEELFPNTDGTLIAAIFLFMMGFVTAAAARNKGRGHIGWFAYGALAPPVPLFFIMVLHPQPPIPIQVIAGVEKCGMCAAIVQENVEFCRNCGVGISRPDTTRR